jgi:hypothetical protein
LRFCVFPLINQLRRLTSFQQATDVGQVKPMTGETIPAAGVVTSNWRLRLVVFTSGAVLMGLEMTGSRVLAIHFGSSIYVWGAIIGIFLAALSLGYYSGGMIADRRPTFYLLNLLLLVAGCWLLLVPLFANKVCLGVLAVIPSDRLGPLVATILLFGGPSVLLGMVSPFAVHLRRRLSSVGNVSGRSTRSQRSVLWGPWSRRFWLIPATGANRSGTVKFGGLAAHKPFGLTFQAADGDRFGCACTGLVLSELAHDCSSSSKPVSGLRNRFCISLHTGRRRQGAKLALPAIQQLR